MTQLTRWPRYAAMALAGWLGVWLIGCTTYVNIPAQPGDVASHNLDDTTVQEVVAGSLRALVSDRSIRGSVAIVLPDGSRTRLFIRDATDINDLIHAWPTAGDQPDESSGPVLEVKQVRVRGWSAGVDVLMRDDPGQLHTRDQLVTVDLRWHALHGWTPERTRLWHRQMPPTIERPNRRYTVISQP